MARTSKNRLGPFGRHEEDAGRGGFPGKGAAACAAGRPNRCKIPSCGPGFDGLCAGRLLSLKESGRFSACAREAGGETVKFLGNAATPAHLRRQKRLGRSKIVFDRGQMQRGAASWLLLCAALLSAAAAFFAARAHVLASGPVETAALCTPAQAVLLPYGVVVWVAAAGICRLRRCRRR